MVVTNSDTNVIDHFILRTHRSRSPHHLSQGQYVLSALRAVCFLPDLVGCNGHSSVAPSQGLGLMSILI